MTDDDGTSDIQSYFAGETFIDFRSVDEKL